jgi:hypothetical protein
MHGFKSFSAVATHLQKLDDRAVSSRAGVPGIAPAPSIGVEISHADRSG